MKFPRWRSETVQAPDASPAGSHRIRESGAAVRTPPDGAPRQGVVPSEALVHLICEACGTPLPATRSLLHPNRVRCRCGHDNHLRRVAGPGEGGSANETEFVLSCSTAFRATPRDLDMLLPRRFGACERCHRVVSLDRSRTRSSTDNSGAVEICQYFCPSCEPTPSVGPSRLLGYDGRPIADSVRYRSG